MDGFYIDRNWSRADHPWEWKALRRGRYFGEEHFRDALIEEMHILREYASSRLLSEAHDAGDYLQGIGYVAFTDRQTRHDIFDTLRGADAEN